MNEQRFRQLRRDLIRGGVAARHARRAQQELQAHYDALCADARARGETPQSAAQSAHAALGSDAMLIEGYAQRRELHSWLYRWPAGYVLVPLISFALLCAATMSVIGLTLWSVTHFLRPTLIPHLLTHTLNSALEVMLLWVLPAALAATFMIFARRQRVALQWPIAGAVLLCLVTQLMNVGLRIPQAAHPGSITLGIGIASRTVSLKILVALTESALALTPLLWLRRRPHSDQ